MTPKKQRLFSLVFFMFGCWFSNAQTTHNNFGYKLQRQMLSADGSLYTTTSGVKVSQSIAQQSTIGTFIKEKAILSQGFQQSRVSNKSINPLEPISTVVYPNPVSDFVNFKFSAPVLGKISISIFDVLGRLLLYREEDSIDNLLTVSGLKLADSEYFVILKAKNYSYSTKILTQK